MSSCASSIVSHRILLYRIVSAGLGKTGFDALAGYCLDGKDVTDGLDGALVGRGLSVIQC